MIMNMVSF